MLAKGLVASTLRPLAAAAQTSDRMLLYYFVDKDDVVQAALGEVSRRLAMLLAARAVAPMPHDELLRVVLPMLLDEALWPYMRLWLDIAAHAANGDGAYGKIGGSIARGFLRWIGSQIDSAPDLRATQAARLFVTAEGAIVAKSVGLDDVVALIC